MFEKLQQFLEGFEREQTSPDNLINARMRKIVSLAGLIRIMAGAETALHKFEELGEKATFEEALGQAEQDSDNFSLVERLLDHILSLLNKDSDLKPEASLCERFPERYDDETLIGIIGDMLGPRCTFDDSTPKAFKLALWAMLVYYCITLDKASEHQLTDTLMDSALCRISFSFGMTLDMLFRIGEGRKRTKMSTAKKRELESKRRQEVKERYSRLDPALKTTNLVASRIQKQMPKWSIKTIRHDLRELGVWRKDTM
jgi:hypothetical protein